MFSYAIVKDVFILNFFMNSYMKAWNWLTSVEEKLYNDMS